MADTIIAAPPARVAAPLRPAYIAAAVAALAAMIAAILGSSLWFLDFVHVMTGALWTGIDLFMGFVIGPVLRRVSLDTRRAMIAGIIPRTLDPDADAVGHHLHLRLVPGACAWAFSTSAIRSSGG